MIHDINSINRIMSVVEDLRIKDNTSSEKNVEQGYLKNYFLPIMDKASNVIEFCNSIKLLSNENSRLIITNFGKEFLGLNPPIPYRKYEINPTQKKYLIYRIISSEKYQKEVQDLVRKFMLNENGQLFLNNFKKNSGATFLLNILEQLDFLNYGKESIMVEEEYENELVLYNLNSKNQSLDKFLERKVEEAIRGSIAEHYVLEYERKRLKYQKAIDNINKIKLVSLENVYAGYDIASFDSEESEEFDRFIEVKSSQYSKVHFFISKNEIKRAEQEKNKYWIYYVEMTGRKPIKLRLFRNPIDTIIRNEKEYNIESSQLEITEK
ncbi:MAG: DUF3883 domain-containing protein [Nanoarchaeota archaeon]|nr:DUF3883 domain-containing protein [Nanoarchaeota archaeon]